MNKSASRMLSMKTRCLMQTSGFVATLCPDVAQPVKSQVASHMKEYQKQVLKSKNSLDNFVDKIKTAVSGDAKATGHIGFN